MEESQIMEIINKTKQYIDEKLMPVIQQSGSPLCGNIFTQHHHTNYSSEYINKQKNFVDILNTRKDIKHVMEIGFNSGFSTLLMLMSNSNINVTSVDLGEHKYVIDCYKIIKNDFQDRIILHIGDSREVLPRLNKTFDLIHIDGCHYTDVAEIDIINSYNMCREGGLIVMDDYDCNQHPFNLQGFWDGYSKKYNMEDFTLRFPTIYHNIKTVSNKWDAVYNSSDRYYRYNI